MTRATYLLLLVCVIGGCSFSYSCGKKTVKADEAEASIKSTYQGKGVDVSAVHCDTTNAEPVAGKTFPCKLEVGGGFTYTLLATITSCDNDDCQFGVTFSDGSRVDGKLLTGQIVKMVTGHLTNPQVDCKEPIPLVGADNTVHCAVVSDEFHGDAIVSFEADHETVADIELDSINGDALAATLVKSIADQQHVAAQVDCGGHWIKRTTDGVYHCKVSGVAGVQQLDVTTHPDGTLDWKAAP